MTPPTPGADEAVVEMRAGVVSFVNSLLVRGAYQIKHPLPFVPGTLGIGTVREVGDGFDPTWIGRRVAITQLSGGCLATHALGRREAIAAVPDGVADAEAAAAMEAWSTMHFALTRRHRLSPGERVLVLGAGGSVGRAAVDIASAVGGRVIAAASSARRLDWLAGREGIERVDLATSDLRATLRDLAPEGVDVVIDPVGGAAGLAALKALAPFGTFLVLGFASGEIPRLGANRLLIANKSAVGVDFGHALGVQPELAEEVMSEVLESIGARRYAVGLPLQCALGEVPRGPSLMLSAEPSMARLWPL